MSTDPISEARDAFERAIQNHLLAYAYPAHNPAEVAEKRGEAEARYIALRAAIRAQVDEDVRRLVAAARLADDHIWCECVLQPPPHEDILCKPHKALRAALEPFKAVAPTADAKEADRG